MRQIALALALVSLAACGSPVKKLCKMSEDCDPDYDYDTCVKDYEDLETAADELGCTDVLNDFAKCSAKHGECGSDGYIEATECDAEALAYIGCFFGDSSWTFGTSDTGY